MRPLTPGFSSYPMAGGAAAIRGGVQAGARSEAVPLRPLGVSDLYNGATAYVRANPRATLGVTAAVVVAVQAVRLGAALGLLAITGFPGPAGEVEGSAVAVDGVFRYGVSRVDIATWSAVLTLGISATALGAVLLSAVLITVVGRAVFGESVSAGQVWPSARRRLPALGALLMLGGLATAVPVGLGVLLAVTVGMGTAVILTVLLALPVTAALGYGFIVFAFAVPVVVLERRSAAAAIRRAAQLLRGGFWRTASILVLTAVIGALVSNAVAVPFGVAGAMLSRGWSPAWVPASVVFDQAGATIGQIIVLPFMIGTLALLYADRRFRCEGLDLALRGTSTGQAGSAGSADRWLVQTRWPVRGV